MLLPPPLPFHPFLTFDTSLFLLHLTQDNNTTHTPLTPLIAMDMDRDMSKYTSLLQTAKAEHDLGDLKVKLEAGST